MSPKLILHVQTRPPVAAELLSFSPISPLLVGILSRIPTSYNIVLYPTPATVLMVRYLPSTVVPGKWKGATPATNKDAATTAATPVTFTAAATAATPAASKNSAATGSTAAAWRQCGSGGGGMR